jgi:hypothetical protein
MKPLIIILRVALGTLFVISGAMKLNLLKAFGYPMDPLDFAFAIQGFKLGLPEPLVATLTYVIPYAELIAGALLILGLLVRGAALSVAALMLVFAGGIVSLMVRGIDVNCPCFGKLNMFCGTAPLGLCHLIRNGGFALVAMLIFAYSKPCKVRKAANPSEVAAKTSALPKGSRMMSENQRLP